MALVLADRVRDTTTTTGTGTVTLSGTAPTGYQTFGAAIGNGNTTYYTINAGSQWEVGLGTYSSTGPTLARTTVLSSSNGGSLVDFSTGTKDVFVTYPAEKSINEDASGNVGIGTTAPASKLSVVGGTVQQSKTSGDNNAFYGSTSDTSNNYLRLQNTTGILDLTCANAFSYLVTTQNGPLYFGTNNTERMRIDSSGNVGIGTSSPSSRLTITGGNTEIRDGNYLLLRPSGNAWDMRLQATGTQLDILSGGALGSPIMSLVNGGNVGIGTSSPATKLDILGASSDQIRVRTAGTEFYRFGRNSSTGYMDFYGSQTGYTGYTFGGVDGERMRIDSSGNVGIGTTTPGAALQVNGNTRLSNGTGFTSANSLIRSIQAMSGSANQFISSNIDFYTAAFTDNGQIAFSTGTTERMRIDGSGNVGIGTSSPANRLHIAGSPGTLLRLDGGAGGTGTRDIFFSEFDTAAYGGIIRYDSGADLFTFGTVENSTVINAINVPRSTGNVGIGTTSPGQRLSVSGTIETVAGGNIQLTGASTGDQSIRVGAGRSGNGYSYIDLQGDTTYSNGLRLIRTNGGANSGSNIEHRGTGSLALITQEAAPIAFLTSATERARITSDGYLLVGTTSPMGGNTSSEFKVTAAGSWPLTLNANDRGLLIRNSASSAGVYAYFEYNGGTNNGQISFSGGTTSYVTTSDARVKKNIVDAPDAGALIDAIKVRSWDFKVDDMHWRYGMVAQELISIAPEAVTVPEDEDKMMGIDYSKLVPMLIKEVQSLRARVAQLEGN